VDAHATAAAGFRPSTVASRIKMTAGGDGSEEPILIKCPWLALSW